MATSLRGKAVTRDHQVQDSLRSNVARNGRQMGSDTKEPMIVMIVVSVVYYLSKNGQLEHPHFMEIALNSTPEVFFSETSDVINRMNALRGKGVASTYSWPSSKRSYRGGYVWQDLSEHDLIHPTHGHEYLLKGYELLLLHHEEPNIDARSHDEIQGLIRKVL